MIKPDFLKPDDKFRIDRDAFGLDGGRTVLDFWRWAYSDLVQNVTRGYVAQFIIAWLVGADRKAPNNPWQPFDVQIPGGKRVEVKSTAWLQSWTVGEKNRKPKFEIKPTYPYYDETGFGKEKMFNSDIYALCYYYWKDKNTANILDLSQWKYWAFTQKELIKALEGRKSISIHKLEKLGFRALDVAKMRDTLLAF